MTVHEVPLTFAERAVLAVLASQGPLSARELRRWAATHLDPLVWRPRLSEIYAVLADLESSAHVRGSVEFLDDVRRTRAFSLTDHGRRALQHAVVRSLPRARRCGRGQTVESRRTTDPTSAGTGV